MGRNPGDNLLTRNEDLSKIIPTRYPPKGVPTRCVPLWRALEIAEKFYKSQRAHERNAEYCRARRVRTDLQNEVIQP